MVRHNTQSAFGKRLDWNFLIDEIILLKYCFSTFFLFQIKLSFKSSERFCKISCKIWNFKIIQNLKFRFAKSEISFWKIWSLKSPKGYLKVPGRSTECEISKNIPKIRKLLAFKIIICSRSVWNRYNCRGLALSEFISAPTASSRR